MVAPLDMTAQGFMIAESRNTPMHVGGLQLFDLPEDAAPGWLGDYYEQSLAVERVAPLYLKRPYRSVATGGAWVWKEDPQFDLEHHVRHSALPAPGRVRELLELCGRLHGTRLAVERPLWEMHFIEGLNDGRAAIYSKLHHALVDGVAAMRLLQASLSTDPEARDTPPPWAVRDAADTVEREQAALSEQLRNLPAGAFRSAMAISVEAAGLPSALVRTFNRALRDETAPLSLYAPRTILNQSITGARRFAAQDWPIDRMRAVGSAARVTLNDVVLAMSSGALRHYLLELGELPTHSLVAMVPVSLRLGDADTPSATGGNAVGTIMVNLATDLSDPAARLDRVHRSVMSGKRSLSSMTQPQIVAMSALGVTPVVLTPLLRLQGLTRPPFNLVISNVPGPKRPLYMNGARLSGMYPMSIPVHGQAMNITCSSYDGKMNFGLVGCRRTAPHLQRLLTHLDDELTDLEAAVGVG